MHKLIPKFLIVVLLFGFAASGYSQGTRTRFINYLDADNEMHSVQPNSSLAKLSARAAIEKVHLIQSVNLKASLANGEILLNLPERTVLARTKSDLVSNGSRVWTGDWFDGFILVTETENETSAYIQDGDAILEIQPLSGETSVLIKYNNQQLNKTCGVQDSDAEQGQMVSEESLISSVSPNPLVRVLVLYTPAAANSGYNLSSLVNSAFSQYLNAAVNSSVVVSLQLAGIQPLNFTESSDIDQDTDDLTHNSIAQQLRNTYQADLVMMLTDAGYSIYGGWAQDIGPSEPDAYGIVEVDYATAHVTFVHEMIHLFGGRHQNPPDTHASDTHGHEWITGVWPFRKTWGTIMRTYASNLNRVLHFSNPYISYSGHPTGVTGVSYVSKHININGHIVEDFRYTPPPLTASISGPGSANGGDLLYFQSNVSYGQSPYSYVWKANTGSGYFTIGTSTNVSYTMPGNNDLNIQLTVTDAQQQSVTANHFVLNLYENGGSCNPCPIMDSENLKMENKASGVNLYPVPAKDVLNFMVEGAENEILVRVLNPSGVEVVSKKITGNSNTISGMVDVRTLNEGIYYLLIQGRELTRTAKFVIIH